MAIPNIPFTFQQAAAEFGLPLPATAQQIRQAAGLPATGYMHELQGLSNWATITVGNRAATNGRFWYGYCNTSAYQFGGLSQLTTPNQTGLVQFYSVTNSISFSLGRAHSAMLITVEGFGSLNIPAINHALGVAVPWTGFSDWMAARNGQNIRIQIRIA